MRKVRPWTAVDLEWKDTTAESDLWVDRKGLSSLEPMVCRTIGFVVEMTDDYLTVCQTMTADQVMHRLTIPLSMITSIKRLP